MRIYISSSTSIDISSGDDIPEELLDKVPKVFRTTAVEYDKRIVMGNIRATNDLEISYSSSGIVIIKKGDIIPEELLDKVPKVFKTTGVIPPSPSVEKNAEDIAKNKIAIDTNKIESTKMTTTATATVGENGVEHWVSVASADTVNTGRKQGRVIVSDQSGGRHGFIEIDWMRSYADSGFNVLNSGGHGRPFTGVRILRDQLDTTYGEYILQVRVWLSANYTVSVVSDYNNPGWLSPVAVSPVIEDTKVGFSAFRELTGIKYLGFGTSKGVKFKGDVYTDGHFYDRGRLVGLDEDIVKNNVNATKMTTTATATAGSDNAAHWITVASAPDMRRNGRVIVSDESGGKHSFIEIDWMRSFLNSSFNVLNNGGHERFITGVRVLHLTANRTYGEKILQIRVEREANFTVSIISDYNNPGWDSPVAVAPVVEDTKAGFQIYGREITDIKYLGFATLKGAKFGGDVYTDENFYAGGKLVGLDKAKCFVDITAGDFSGDKDTYGRIVIGNIKYQTPGNNFTVDSTTNEIIVNKEGYYNVEVVLNHSKGASTSVFSNARIQKNSNTTLASGSSGNTDGCSFSLVIRALGEKLSVGDKICIESNGKNDSSPWSTFSIEEV